MNSVRLTHRSAQVAVFVRLAAFLLAAVSVFVIPAAVAAAASHHMSHQAAYVTSAVCAALTLLTSLVARSLDPMRG